MGSRASIERHGMTVAAPAIVETRDERRKRLDRERQARCRARRRRGARVVVVPAEIADEIDADTDEEFARAAAAILRRGLGLEGA